MINALGQNPNQVTDGDDAYAVLIQPDGKTVLGGEQIPSSGNTQTLRCCDLTTTAHPTPVSVTAAWS